MSFNNSPNMGLPVPSISNEPGPQYAADVNQCLAQIDSHNHAFGNGIQIGAQGINLTSDLPFNVNNATLLRSAKFVPTTATSGTDIGCIYVKGADLFYNDIGGNVVRLTANGGLSTTALFQGLINTTAIISATGGTPATSGFIRMNNNTDFVSWRNAANSGDDKIYFDSNDILNIVGNGLASNNLYGTGQGPLANNSISTSGTIGEYLVSSFNSGPNGSGPFSNQQGFGPSGSFLIVNSLALSVGDWDVSGLIQIGNNSVGSSAAIIQFGLSQQPSSATFSDAIVGFNSFYKTNAFFCPFAGGNNEGDTLFIPSIRFATSAAATIYIKASATYSAAIGSSALASTIRARRMR